MSPLREVKQSQIVRAHDVFDEIGGLEWISENCVIDEVGAVDYEQTFAQFGFRQQLANGRKSYVRGSTVIIGSLQCAAERELAKGHELGHLVVLSSADPVFDEMKGRRNDDLLEAFCELFGYYCLVPTQPVTELADCQLVVPCGVSI